MFPPGSLAISVTHTHFSWVFSCVFLRVIFGIQSCNCTCLSSWSSNSRLEERLFSIHRCLFCLLLPYEQPRLQLKEGFPQTPAAQKGIKCKGWGRKKAEPLLETLLWDCWWQLRNEGRVPNIWALVRALCGLVRNSEWAEASPAHLTSSSFQLDWFRVGFYSALHINIGFRVLAWVLWHIRSLVCRGTQGNEKLNLQTARKVFWGASWMSHLKWYPDFLPQRVAEVFIGYWDLKSHL